MASPLPQAPPPPPSLIVPGAWPDQSQEIPTPDSPQHLDQVLSFHKRLSLSFSSPILMPIRSPLLTTSMSGSSAGVTIGPQHETSTCIAVLADESFSSVDSAHEVASPTNTNFSAGPSEATSLSSASSDTQHAYYSSPAIDRHRPVFSAPPTTSHAARRKLLPRLDLSVPDPSENKLSLIEALDTSISSTDSALATPLTPPSPRTPASPGPIVFASPSSSSVSFRAQFPSTEPLAMATEDVSAASLSNRPQSLMFYNAHIRAGPLPVSLDQLRTDSDSTAWTSHSDRDENLLSSTGVRPRKPWRDFARDNSTGPSPLTRNQSDVGATSSSVSRRNSSVSSGQILSTIQTTAPPSRSHTISLSLARPTHNRRISSGSLLAPTAKSFLRSNSTRSSPQLTPRPSFPSRPPSPAHVTRPSKRERVRSNSISLFRNISNRSKTRFSRSEHTGNVSVAAADYAAAQCEEAFVTEVNTIAYQERSSVDILVEDHALTQDVQNEFGLLETQVRVTVSAGVDGEKTRRSVFRKVKKLGVKLRAIVRGSVVARGKEGVKVRVDVTNTSEPVTTEAGNAPETGPRARNKLKSSRSRPASFVSQFSRNPFAASFISSPTLPGLPVSSSPRATEYDPESSSQQHISSALASQSQTTSLEPAARPRDTRTTFPRPSSLLTHFAMPAYPFVGTPSPPSPSMSSPSVPFSPRPTPPTSIPRHKSTMRSTSLPVSASLQMPSSKPSPARRRRNSVELTSPRPTSLLSYLAMPGAPFMGMISPPSPTIPPPRPVSSFHTNSNSRHSPARRPTSWAVPSVSAPNEGERSPTLTMPVEPKARAMGKSEEIELDAFAPVPEETSLASGSGSTAVPEEMAEYVDREPTAAIANVSTRPSRRMSVGRFSFARMSGFWGWDGLIPMV